jgi:hypothetical protein
MNLPCRNQHSNYRNPYDLLPVSFLNCKYCLSSSSITFSQGQQSSLALLVLFPQSIKRCELFSFAFAYLKVLLCKCVFCWKDCSVWNFCTIGVGVSIGAGVSIGSIYYYIRPWSITVWSVSCFYELKISPKAI